MVVNGPIDDQLSFDDFCDLLKTLERKPNELRRKEVTEKAKQKLSQFFKERRDKLRNCQGQLSGAKPDSLFGILRLLLPDLDKARRAFGLKEKSLGQLIIDIFGVSKTAPDARDLINYQVPKNTTASTDFAAVAYTFLRHRCPQVHPDSRITIRTINAWLDGLVSAKANPKTEPGMQKKIMKKCLLSLTAFQNMWLIRIILKNMQLKLSQKVIFEMFHTDAKEVYDTHGRLEEVVAKLVDPAKRANDIKVELFSAFRPMPVVRSSIATLAKDMKHVAEVYCETKLDGERVLLHKEGHVYKYFSRNQNECMGPFGRDPKSGSLTQFIHGCFKPEVKNCILDGEMVIWDRDSESIVQKGENSSLNNLKPGEKLQPCFVVFDVILLNDEDLTCKPLKERYKVLFGQVFHEEKGRMFFTKTKLITTERQVVDAALNYAIEHKEEGIVLKLPDSKYIPAARSSGWYKFKPEYEDSLMDELDLIVVGGYHGQGNRQGLVSNFLLGLAVPSQLGDKPKQFETVSRVGMGLSRDVMIKLSNKLKSIKQYGTEAAPKWIVAKKEKATIWFEPSESVILQIKASQIVPSNKEYAAGWSLRFPRITAWREDKAWWDCMTTKEFDQLRTRGGGSLVRQPANYQSDTDSDGVASTARTTQRGTTKRRKAATRTHDTVAKQFRSVDQAKIDQVSEVFGGKSFCIISGTEKESKEELQKSVLAFGGKCSEKAVAGEIYCVVAKDDSHPRVRVYMNGRYDVVKVDWLVRSLKSGKLLPWGPLDVLATSSETRERFESDYDVYGDSYTLPATMESLKYSMERVEESGDRTLVSNDDMKELESRSEWEWSDGSNSGLFRGCKAAYFHIHDDLPFFSPLPRLKAMFTFYGGQAAKELREGVSHVILDRRDAGKIEHFNLLNRERPFKFHLVYSNWIEKCMEEQSLIREEPYVAVRGAL